ncbi:MAG: YncE family protein [Bryobacteraceae bacterium]
MNFRFCLLITASVALAADGYEVKQRIPIGGGDTWGYLALDESARRLYIANEMRVVVLDIDAGKVVGEIPDTPGIHGVALAPELGKGFTSNGRANNVTIFDLKTLKPLAEVATGKDPDSILFEPQTARVFTFNIASNDATAIDAKTGEVAGRIKLDGKPTFAVADGSGRIWFNLQILDADWSILSEVGVIDAAKLAVLRQSSIAPCDGPVGLAVDAKNDRLFSVCGNKTMAVIDAETGKVIATVPVGGGAGSAGFDPGSGLAFSSNGGDGTLTVVGEVNGKFEAVQTVLTMRGARTLAVDPKTHNIYLPAVELGPPPTMPVISNSLMLLVVGK